MKIKEILFPKSNERVGKNKPVLILMNSPYDKLGGSVRLDNAIKLAYDRGFTVLNRDGFFNYGNKALEGKLKANTNPKSNLTIWLESHGAPGWLFGNEKSEDGEMKSAIEFAKYILFLEEKYQAKISEIILNGCYSANEYCNTQNYAYFLCPARVLSLLLPDRSVIGFIGKNASVKTHVFIKKNQEKKGPQFIEKMLSIEDAAILFVNGEVREAKNNDMYCDHKYTPDFIREACDISEEESYYLPTFGKELVASLRGKSIHVEKSLGDRQLSAIKEYQEKSQHAGIACTL